MIGAVFGTKGNVDWEEDAMLKPIVSTIAAALIVYIAMPPTGASATPISQRRHYVLNPVLVNQSCAETKETYIALVNPTTRAL
jgi:hypothetical protein